MITLHRLLLILVVTSGFSLSVRLGAIWHEAGIAFAESSPPGGTTPAAKPDASKPDAAKVEPAKADAKGDPAKPDASKNDPAKPAGANQKFSPAEVELLQELSKRRAELDQRADELDRRELLLKATEQHVQENIDKLQQMQTQVDASLGKVDEQEGERLKSLVHMYEGMKPVEAARIFEQLDMPVLLQLMTHMKDQKTGPILASMATDKAKAVTIALAEKKQQAPASDAKTN
jgi:flagellar motility protein MotE (MotC chaperone)